MAQVELTGEEIRGLRSPVDSSRFQRTLDFLQENNNKNINLINSTFAQAGVLKTLSIEPKEGTEGFVVLCTETTGEVEGTDGASTEIIDKYIIDSTSGLFEFYIEHHGIFDNPEASSEIQELNEKMLSLGESLGKQFVVEKIKDEVGDRVQRIIEGLDEEKRASFDAVLLALKTTGNTDKRAEFLNFYTQNPQRWNCLISDLGSERVIPLIRTSYSMSQTAAFLNKIEGNRLSNIIGYVMDSSENNLGVLLNSTIDVGRLALCFNELEYSSLQKIFGLTECRIRCLTVLFNCTIDTNNLIVLLNHQTALGKLLSLLGDEAAVRKFSTVFNNISNITPLLHLLTHVDLSRFYFILSEYDQDDLLLFARELNRSISGSKMANRINRSGRVLPLLSIFDHIGRKRK